MLFLHVWWRIMRFSQPLDGTLCIFVCNSNGVYETCFFSKLINRRQVDGLSSHPCFEELEWHRGRQLQCFRNTENSRQCPESTKKTELCEILPANCWLQKKIINFKHNCCFSDMCCCYWSHFINYVKLFFSRVNSFLDIYEWKPFRSKQNHGWMWPHQTFFSTCLFYSFQSMIMHRLEMISHRFVNGERKDGFGWGVLRLCHLPIQIM